MFTLADGRVITDEDTGAEIASSGFGPLIASIDIAVAKIGRTLPAGAEFSTRSTSAATGPTDA